MGFQYIRLMPDGNHSVFAPCVYDRYRVESMLSNIAKDKFNILRVFVGNLQLVENDRLNVEFLRNMVDFAKKCRRYGIRIIIVPDHIPPISKYQQVTDKSPHQFEGSSSYFFDYYYIQAKKWFIGDLITQLQKLDPLFASTVFSWEFENEAEIELNLKPFSTKGMVSWNNKQWDIANPDECQNLLDKAIIKYSNELSAQVRKLLPSAQTSLSVFTLRAVGRTGIRKMWRDTTQDHRLPFRPLALAQSNLSYVDIHFYGASPQAFAEDKACCEWTRLVPYCIKSKKPIFSGEFGTFTTVHKTEAEAASAMRWYLLSLIADGVDGACYWTYDCTEQPDLWHAKMGNGMIYNELAGINRNMQSYHRKIKS